MPPPHTVLGSSLQHTVFTNGISSDVKKTLSTTVLSPSAEVHLTLHDVPLGSKKWTITRERVQAALKELPLWQIMNENQLLHHVVSSKRLNEWLTSKINEIEQDYGFLVLGRPVWALRRPHDHVTVASQIGLATEKWHIYAPTARVSAAGPYWPPP